VASEKRTARWRGWVIALVAVLVVGGVAYEIAVTTGFSLTPYPRIVGKNCGQAFSGYGGTTSVDPDQAEQCFWNAYATCQTATIVFELHGVDTGETHAITVQRRDTNCTLTDAVQGFSDNFGGSRSRVTTYRCLSLQQQHGGLLLSGCVGERDLYVPPRPPEQVGHVCGIVENTYNVVARGVAFANNYSVAQIEDCFWQAYMACTHPATLIYQSDHETGELTTHTLVAQEQGGTCTVTDAVQGLSQPEVYTCAVLTQIAGGGLVAHGCGAEGDLTIPRASPGYS
jgi:hypothetical protein